METAKPICTVLGGPNGSGKSSVYEKLRPPGLFINADNIEAELSRELPPGERRIKAGRMVVQRIREAIEERQDFVFETTLSSRHALGVMHNARAAGFFVGLLYIVTSDPSENVKRVARRVLMGGHDIPEADIRRRYDGSLSNLGEAMSIAHESVIVDNTQRKPVLIVKATGDQLVFPSSDAPLTPFHRRLIEIAEMAAAHRN